MLRREDCLALCDLSEDAVLAIAEHEHLPEMAAVELGNALVHTPDGERCIKAMIEDDIVAAAIRGDRTRTITLQLVLRNFVLEHPCCASASTAAARRA